MNPKKIGAFFKQLRNEKGITQEQLAEILGVSGRTVSRWETGTNLPDLSILVKISEYYKVEIKEILNGERESGNMEDKKLKDTLLKVSDYNELEKQRAAKTGNLSFCIMFLVCAAAITVQLLAKGKLSLVMGETAALLAGGLAYIFSAAGNGVWDGAFIKSTPKKDFIVSLVCVGGFSVLFWLMLKGHMAPLLALGLTACFFAVLSAVSYALLRRISRISNDNKQKKERNAEGGF